MSSSLGTGLRPFLPWESLSLIPSFVECNVGTVVGDTWFESSICCCSTLELSTLEPAPGFSIVAASCCTKEDCAVIKAVLFGATVPSIASASPYVEVETNGSMTPRPEFDAYIKQYNISPKLESSNMPKHVRQNENALQFFKNSSKSFFKFVITSENDINEILSDFVDKFNIRANRVYLMPLSNTREELIRNTKLVADLCLKYGFNYSSRLQLLIWNECTGV